MKTMSPLSRATAHCASVALAACTLPSLAMPGGHGHGGHGATHPTPTGQSAAHTSSPSAMAHTPAPAQVSVHVAKPEPLTAARVHEAGERVRTSPMPEVRPGYYGNPNAAATLRVQSKPVPPEFSKLQPATPAHPDHVKEVGGNGSPRVAFNRRSIGGGSGVDSVKRDDAYRLADNRPPPGTPAKAADAPGQEWRKRGDFRNAGPVELPAMVNGQPAEYVKHQPLKEPPAEKTLRIVVAKHPQDLKAAAQDPSLKDSATGPGYLSRHYGDRLKGSPPNGPAEPVHRVQ